MLPPVIHETECHLFKFWFHGDIREGMVYRTDLFCRLRSVPSLHRANLYQEACRLAMRDEVIVTAALEHHTIWVSLRSKNCVRLLQTRYPARSEQLNFRGSLHSISS